MCGRVFFDGNLYTSVRELAKLVGPKNLVWANSNGQKQNAQAEHCLCPIDCDLTGRNAGYITEYDEINDSHWTKP